MKLFIFKIHEDRHYVAGMAAIVAMTSEEACDYLKTVKDNEVWPGIESDDLFLEESDTITLVRHQGDRGSLYHNEWYLAETFDLSHGYCFGGVRCISYHDG